MSPARFATRRKRVPSSSLEPLEARIAPATFTVTTTADSGVGSLRQAMLDANVDTTLDHIVFSIPGGVTQQISIFTPLPMVTGPIDLDGSTQPGNSDWPQIIIAGTSGLAAATDGLSFFNSLGSTVAGVSVVGFPGSGLKFNLSGNNTVVSSTFGISILGVNGNAVDGIYLLNSNGNTLGAPGGAPGSGGLIVSGNHLDGISLAGSNGNQILGCKIGTDGTGLQAVGNGEYGVYLSSSSADMIGQAGAGNVISGNGVSGVKIVNSQTPSIKGNIIGLGADGVTSLGNHGSGIDVFGNHAVGTAPQIGGTAPGEGNVISGNAGDGITLGAAYGLDFPTYYIQGNLIGTDKNGNVQPYTIDAHGARQGGTGNYVRGIMVFDSAGIGIGGTVPSARNVISGNGALVAGKFNLDTALGGLVLDISSNSVVSGNYIGTDGTGTKAAGNLNDGIRVKGGSATIGGTTAGARNIISANGLATNTADTDHRNGITISDRATVTVAGNDIGTDVTGAVDLGNYLDGVRVENTNGRALVNIGGLGAVNQNVISGNGGYGIQVGAQAPLSTAFVSDVNIGNDFIGTNAVGAGAIGNDAGGIFLTKFSEENSIGEISTSGGSSSAGNVISGNGGSGIVVEGSNPIIEDNTIGLSANNAKALGNQLHGVEFRSTSLGGILANNVIAANGFGAPDGKGAGVVIGGSRLAVYLNKIGTSVNSALPLGNAGDGVLVMGITSTVMIGSDSPFLANTIAGNGGHGIEVNAPNATGVKILNNNLGLGPFPSVQNQGDGIFLAASPLSVTTISGNTITNNRGSGIELGNGAGASIKGNFIYGQGLYGINLNQSWSGTVIQGNYIGMKADGVTPSPNITGGISIYNTNDLQIGGVNPGEGNVISGNASTGIIIDVGCTGTMIQGNYIGTDKNGNVIPDSGVSNGTGNAAQGILVMNGSGVTIGGAVAGARNIISGNGLNGANAKTDSHLYGGVVMMGTVKTIIAGNYIGTDGTGELAEGNYNDGIRIDGGDDNVIGGNTALARNVISGNGVLYNATGAEFRNGITITGDASVTVSGNDIGTDAMGTKDLGNALDGIRIGSLGRTSFTSAITLGGAEADEGNVISGNGGYGIRVGASTIKGKFGINEVRIGSNFIGTDASGLAAIGNDAGGIFLDSDSSGTGVGGWEEGKTEIQARNVISGNKRAGIEVRGGSQNIENNYIGLDALGVGALGNYGAGVLADGNTSVSVSGNVISANGFLSEGHRDPGLSLNGSVFLVSNIIGLNAGQTAALGNAGDGIYVYGLDTGAYIGDSEHPNIIGGNGGDGIRINVDAGLSPESATIFSNLIGRVGDQAFPNAGNGIRLESSHAEVEGNVISSNGLAGIRVDSSGGGEIKGNQIDRNGTYGVNLIGAKEVTVTGNTIGLLADGMTAAGNAAGGIYITGISIDTTGPTIGGLNVADRNIISGNGGSGITIENCSAGTVIEGNYIGVNREGNGDAGNAGSGIYVHDSTGVQIGGVVAGARNVIAGNSLASGPATLVDIAGGMVFADSSNGLIAGNYIGINAAGTEAVSNDGGGIRIDGGSGNVIGGNTAGARNIISGNVGDGIRISGQASVAIEGNYIGTDATGTAPIGNTGNGIEAGEQFFTAGAPEEQVLIGGPDSADGNVISGNGNHGILVWAALSDPGTPEVGVQIGKNFIGTDATGTRAVSNWGTGIFLSDSSGNVRVGSWLLHGEEQPAGNVISGNAESGIVADGSGHRIENNYIGVDVTGTAALGNGFTGLDIGADGSHANGIQVVANVISANGYSEPVTPGAGVSIDGDSISLSGNIIGLDATRSHALGNAGVGVAISGVGAGVILGGDGTDAGNVIGGNGGDGISIDSVGVLKISILNNSIGVSDGRIFPNGGHGVHVVSSDPQSVEVRGNLIASNAGAGVAVEAAGHATILDNRILNNRGLAIDLNVDGPTANDPLDADSGGNGLQNNITFASAVLSYGETLVLGSFDGAPNRDLEVEFFSYTMGGLGQENGGARLYAAEVHTDATGHAAISFDEGAVAPGTRIGATVTDLGNGDTSEFSYVTATLPPAVFAVGTGRGTVGKAALADLSGASADSILTVIPYGAKFRGGVNVAHADVNHDGIDDLITAPQTGREPVKVFSGVDGSLLASWMAGPPRFAGGVTVVAGDTDGDGMPEIITSVGHGAAPLVTIHDALTGASKGSFLAFAAASRTGVNLAVGDLDGDGRAEIVASTLSGRAAVHEFHGDGTSANPVFRPFANVGSFGAHVTVYLYGDMPMLLIGSGEGVRSTVASYTPDGDPWLPAFRVGDARSTGAVSLATIHFDSLGGAYDVLVTSATLPTIETGSPQDVSGDDRPFFAGLPRGVRLNLG